jgi:hypothetical protein
MQTIYYLHKSVAVSEMSAGHLPTSVAISAGDVFWQEQPDEHVLDANTQ